MLPERSIAGAAAAAGSARQARRSLFAGTLVGIGLMAAVDEIVFHQLLAWHHFYDRATPALALFSDGLLHAAELIVLVAGFFLLGDLLQRRALARRHAIAGAFLGLGGFQMFDGIVDHKVLRLHQIRYGVENLWLYDLVWIGTALLLFLVGLLLWRFAGREQALSDKD